MKFSSYEGLIVVDVQKDFCAGGALAVPEAEKIIPIINEMIPFFDTVVYTKDWHPESHISFDPDPSYGDMSWPKHCVKNTDGAELHPKLKLAEKSVIIHKGTDPVKEAYSGFSHTNLAQMLTKRGMRDLYICGLATDYCVRNTAMDALKHQFRVFLITDAIRGVSESSSKEAIEEMRAQGVSLLTSESLLLSYASLT